MSLIDAEDRISAGDGQIAASSAAVMTIPYLANTADKNCPMCRGPVDSGSAIAGRFRNRAIMIFTSPKINDEINRCLYVHYLFYA
jgi:hypothetical protein